MGIDGSLTTRDERAQRAALRDGVLACGRRIGWSTHTTIAFTEGLARRPWKRCSPAQLAAALDELQATLQAVDARRRRTPGEEERTCASRLSAAACPRRSLN